MKVKATQQGFYGNQIRNIGDEFEATKESFSSRWMEKLSKPGPKAKTVVEPSEAPKTTSFNS
jgi:hypothetical protein